MFTALLEEGLPSCLCTPNYCLLDVSQITEKEILSFDVKPSDYTCFGLHKQPSSFQRNLLINSKLDIE